MSHADDLQAVSVDEALIDVTEVVSQLRRQAAAEGSQYDPAKDYAETIRAEVRKVTGCEGTFYPRGVRRSSLTSPPVSIGIAHNILLARLATRKAKPGGSYHLLPEDVAEYLAPLELTNLHGFGRHTKQKAIEKLGTVNLGELAKKSKSQLSDALGKGTGEKLYNGLRGIDDQQLESDKPRKSVSCEINVRGVLFTKFRGSLTCDHRSMESGSRTMNRPNSSYAKWQQK
jgi:DNA repair protein REV1